MKKYLDLLQLIFDEGVEKGDRTGTGTLSIFGPQLEFDLSEGFPLLTTKKLHFKSIAYELLWFLRGDSNIKYLTDHGVRIWNEWADKDGELGPIYGVQWRKWNTADGLKIDQVNNLIQTLRTDPNDRRMMVSALNVGEMDKMALPPCHLFWQVWVGNGKLSLKMYQRSVDTFLGLPFNIASYALLLMMIAHVTGYQPGRLILSLGDTHLYNNHLEQARVQLSREPLPLPKVELNPKREEIDDFVFQDIALTDHVFHPHIPGKISV